MIIVGLTGGIASGKSTVSSFIMELNIPIIDGDKIAREIVEPNSPLLEVISTEFGKDILNKDGTLNRKMLGNIVFHNSVKLKKLNDITHPKIKEIIKNEIYRYQQENESICIVDAAVLIEANFTDLVDYIILVYVDKKTQIQRLRARDNITEVEALKRIEAQMPFEEKKKFSDFIINNNKDLVYTKDQLSKIINEILLMEDAHV